MLSLVKVKCHDDMSHLNKKNPSLKRCLNGVIESYQIYMDCYHL